MLVIGHRGAAGVAPENSLEALRAGVDAGADMLEFDIHLTKDQIPVLTHDNNLFRTHRKRAFVHNLTFDELKKLTADCPNPIISLEEVLDEFYGEILLNIEIKQRGMAQPVVALLEEKYIKHQTDWDLFVFSSFIAGELSSIRKLTKKAHLWLLHKRNPFIFIAYARRIQLDGVGFHRLYVNDFALAIAQKTNLFTYAYTVNRPAGAKQLSDRGLDGVVSDYPAKVRRGLK
ncbi:MAG TPA: glycerophosphodiester phosphodiesterase family protein [Candidatus Saccharimonadales bacterium]|jgi:glycerophosphoryl diester phosphodiesterase|nr:glycerophosphodiester phosphodiesterase family protein [Candidatus Saccharimonadales bacterium]